MTNPDHITPVYANQLSPIRQRADKLGKEAWATLPASECHIVIVFRRDGSMMAYDAGTDAGSVKRVLFKVMMDPRLCGLWNLTKLMLRAYYKRTLRRLGILAPKSPSVAGSE